ncbi:MAG TPA: hypothetical protein PLP33_14550 [Leptospiraceae bacterium]|nr:hypothetical protein [Leptospiraceae bacterium]
MQLFGSRLIKNIFPDFRNPKDLDFFSVGRMDNDFPSQFNNIKECEVYTIPLLPCRELTANEIYTVKVSHAIYNIHWPKHMSDIRFLQLKGCSVDEPLLHDLRRFWKTVHTDDKYKRFDFSNKENIFDDKLSRKEPHDRLHLLFSTELNFPKFSDGAIPNEQKWNLLSPEMKHIICVEEAYVVALERFYGSLPPKMAYHKAQQLLITKLHPVFIADWAIQNWKTIYTPERDYYDIYERVYFRKD